MGFKRSRMPVRLDFYSVFDEAIDTKEVDVKYGSFQNFMDAVNKDPHDRSLFPLKGDQRLAQWRFRALSADEMVAVRDRAARWTSRGTRYSSRFVDNHNLALFREALVEVKDLFPGEDVVSFGGEPAAEGEALKGRIEDVFTLVPVYVQMNLGMLLQAAIEDATANQGK